MNKTVLRALTRMLWPDGDRLAGPQVWCLLDAARDPAIAPMVRQGRLEHACLFSGDLHPRLQAAAPYLVHLAAHSPTTDLLLRHGWGKGWGILAVAPADVSLDGLRLHFKKLLRVRTEQGGYLGFRYYDPDVLNVYLPTCTGAEARTFFGPVTRFLAEEHLGAGVRTFDRHAQQLVCDSLSLDAAAPEARQLVTPDLPRTAPPER